MAFIPTGWLDALRTVDRLFALERSLKALIEKQGEQIAAIQDRLTRLESLVQAREEILVAEAKGASAAVASSVASQHVAGLAQAMGVMQERLDSLTRDRVARLAPPPARKTPPVKPKR